MTRFSILLLIICSLPTDAASPTPEIADRLSSPRRFQKKAMRLRRSESVPSTPSSGATKLRLPDPKWETRRVFKSSKDEVDKECLFYSGKEVACTPGRFGAAFSSSDGSRQAYTSITGVMGPQVGKRIVFVTNQGVLLREEVIPTGGVPIFALAAAAGRLFILFQQAGGAVLAAYDLDSRELWKKALPGLKVASNHEGMLRVTSDARRLIVATNPDFQKGGSGKTFIFDGEGNNRAEFGIENALSKISPDGSWAAVWTPSSLHIVDLKIDREKSSIDFEPEDGAAFSVEDISPDSRRILVAKRRRNDPKTGAKPRIQKFLVIDPIVESISETNVDEEMEVSASCRFAADDSIEMTTRTKRVRFDVAP